MTCLPPHWAHVGHAGHTALARKPPCSVAAGCARPPQQTLLRLLHTHHTTADRRTTRPRRASEWDAGGGMLSPVKEGYRRRAHGRGTFRQPYRHADERVVSPNGSQGGDWRHHSRARLQTWLLGGPPPMYRAAVTCSDGAGQTNHLTSHSNTQHRRSAPAGPHCPACRWRWASCAAAARGSKRHRALAAPGMAAHGGT